MLADLERLSDAYALATLDRLGWKRVAGANVDSTELRESLGVGGGARTAVPRMLEMQARAGVLEEAVRRVRRYRCVRRTLPRGWPTTPIR